MKKIVRRLSVWILCLLLMNPLTCMAEANVRVRLGVQNFKKEDGQSSEKVTLKLDNIEGQCKLLWFAGTEDETVWICTVSRDCTSEEEESPEFQTEEAGYEESREPRMDVSGYEESQELQTDVPRAERIAVAVFEADGKSWEYKKFQESRTNFRDVFYKIEFQESAEDEDSPGKDSMNEDSLFLCVDHLSEQEKPDGTAKEGEYFIRLGLAEELYGFKADVQDGIVWIQDENRVFSEEPDLYIGEGRPETGENRAGGITLKKCMAEVRFGNPETEALAEVKAETETEAASKESENRKLTEPESKADTEQLTEPESEADTEQLTGPESEQINEPETESETETGIESEPGTETESKPEAEPENEPGTEPETKPGTETRTGTETEIKAEPETEEETGEEARIEAEIKIEPELGTETEAETGTAPETETELESKTAPETETELETETEPETGAETEIETETEPETEAETETETEIETETEPESESGTEIESETERKAAPAAVENGNGPEDAGPERAGSGKKMLAAVLLSVLLAILLAVLLILRKKKQAQAHEKERENREKKVKGEERENSNYRSGGDEDTINPDDKIDSEDTIISALKTPAPGGQHIIIRGAVANNKGRVRGNNEDNFCFNGAYMRRREMDQGVLLTAEFADAVQLFAVCDGMGGADAGEEASHRAAKELSLRRQEYRQMASQKGLTAILRMISERINQEAEQRGQKSGTTIAMMLVSGGRAMAANVGDSRVYRFRNRKLTQVSVDHSRVQRMIAMGLLTPEQAKKDPGRHVITQYLGMPSEIKVSPYIVSDLDLRRDDVYLLCSDGLTDMVEDSQIEAILREKRRPKEAVQTLLRAALENGGRDNVTVMLLYV